MKSTWIALAVSWTWIFVFGQQSQASPVDLSNFSDGAIVESFEGLDRPRGTSRASINLPTPFTFPSGVTLTQPAPNRTDSFGPFIVEFGGFFGYGYADIWDKIPDGYAYLGQANPGLFDNGIEFTFSRKVFRAGACITTAPYESEPFLVSVYGDQGNLLESTMFPGLGSIDDWKNNFIGFERREGISRIVFRGTGGGVLRLDTLVFEQTFPLLGDANLDGYVDDGDLSRLLANWGLDTDWARGNFNYDHIVDDDDLSMLLASWTGPPVHGTIIPEPATLSLLILGGLALIHRRR